MAMTPQQARIAAMQLRARKPELQNMAVEDLISQIMMADGMGAPGAGAGGLADLFPTQLSPASPAPMQAGRLAAPKPTAAIIPAAGADAFRRAQEVRERTERGPTPAAREQANSRVDDLVAGLRPSAEARAPAVVTAAPAAAPEAAPEVPAKPKFMSRYRPLLEQAQAELEQLDAEQQAITAQGKAAPPEMAYKFQNLSGKVSQLKGMVAAEEGAVVNDERAAVLERQTKRLGREEELVEQARKRAPFDALIAGGAALGSARPGESFTSALTRGLAAGNESYSGARDARETALRGIEEKRDAFTLQKIDALQKARDEAIALSDAGYALDKRQKEMASLDDAGILSLATRGDKISAAGSEAKKLKVEADYAEQLKQLEVRKDEAEIAVKAAQEWSLRNPTAGKTGAGSVTKPVAALVSAITSRINVLTKALSDPFVSAADKKIYRAEIAQANVELKEYKKQFGIGVTAPAAAKPAGRIVSSKPIK